MSKNFLIKVNGNQYEVEVEEVNGSAKQGNTQKEVAPKPIMKIVPAQEQPKVETTASNTGNTTVTSPMPGTILKVNVQAGDIIKKGHVLLILEAMKMENEISAPADGKVATVNVAAGKQVAAGEVLVSIDSI